MKHDKTYKASNPTQGLSTSGKLEDCRNKSTYSFEQKSMKAHGSPKISNVLGKYVQAVTSLMISFDKAMKIVFSEEAAQDAARISLQPASPQWNEFCAFFTVTITPIFFGWIPWWLGFLLLFVFLGLNEFRYEVVRLSNY